MPYRARDNVWFNAPGVVAAYQPVAAPDSFAARQNVGNDQRMAGRHTAAPGVAPTWVSATGWTFNGTDQYLATGVIPGSNSSILVEFDSYVAPPSIIASLAGVFDTAHRFYLVPTRKETEDVAQYGFGDGLLKVAPGFTAGNMAMAAISCYRNGIYEGALPGRWVGTTTRDI